MSACLIGYEAHWACANSCDQVAALRRGAARHETREQAEAEARSLCPPRADMVALVVEVRG